MKIDVVGFGFKDEGAAMALLGKDRSQLDDDEKIAIEGNFLSKIFVQNFGIFFGIHLINEIAVAGLPKLGTDIRSQIRVKESKEFKVRGKCDLKMRKFILHQ